MGTQPHRPAPRFEDLLRFRARASLRTARWACGAAVVCGVAAVAFPTTMIVPAVVATGLALLQSHDRRDLVLSHGPDREEGQAVIRVSRGDALLARSTAVLRLRPDHVELLGTRSDAFVEAIRLLALAAGLLGLVAFSGVRAAAAPVLALAVYALTLSLAQRRELLLHPDTTDGLAVDGREVRLTLRGHGERPARLVFHLGGLDRDRVVRELRLRFGDDLHRHLDAASLGSAATTRRLDDAADRLHEASRRDA